MYKLSLVTTFYTEREEQAQYIEKLYQDLQSLIDCESSDCTKVVLEKVDRGEEVLKPATWCSLLGVRISDPDGWRGINSLPMDQPITREEFDKRFAMSKHYGGASNAN